jgi:hypothetical protein
MFMIASDGFARFRHARRQLTDAARAVLRFLHAEHHEVE